MDGDSSLLPSVAKMNVNQLAQLYHAMFTVTVSDEIVLKALEHICGKGARVASQAQILPILQLVHDLRGINIDFYISFC